jgi:hypothetical protein
MSWTLREEAIFGEGYGCSPRRPSRVIIHPPHTVRVRRACFHSLVTSYRRDSVDRRLGASNRPRKKSPHCSKGIWEPVGTVQIRCSLGLSGLGWREAGDWLGLDGPAAGKAYSTVQYLIQYSTYEGERVCKATRFCCRQVDSACSRKRRRTARVVSHLFSVAFRSRG